MSDTPTIWVVGSLNADLVQRVERIPLPGETLPGDDLLTIPGGKGANQACAAAKLGGRVRMIGNVGEDELGTMLVESLQDAGANTDGVERVKASTGVASILVLENGDNAIIISPGANGQLTPDDVRSRLVDLRPGDLVLCQLETPLDTVAAALRLAHDAGAITALDPAPAVRLPRDIIESTRFLTPNETEAPVLLGLPSDADPAVDDALSELAEVGATGIILKLGEKGCAGVHEGECHHVPGHAVDVVDTIAAGDTFNGAFAVALAEGGGVADGLVFANAAAAISVTRTGAQTSIPNRSEVDQFMTLQQSN